MHALPYYVLKKNVEFNHLGTGTLFYNTQHRERYTLLYDNIYVTNYRCSLFVQILQIYIIDEGTQDEAREQQIVN